MQRMRLSNEMIRPSTSTSTSSITRHPQYKTYHQNQNVPSKLNHQTFINLISHSFPLSLPTLSSSAAPKPPRPLPSLKMQNNSSSSSSSSSSSTTMDSTSNDAEEVAYDIPPIMKVYKNGRIERLAGEDVVPPSLDPTTNVESKDVVISREQSISARLFLPKTARDSPNQKLPLFLYFHGGAFCIETPFSPNYHNLLNSVVSKANAIGVSVHYRRAPEHPVPTAHEDSWVALKWVASHVGGNGPDEWLNRHADFGNVFLSGDSAGANIAHYLGVRVGTEEGRLEGLKIEGLALVHPYFWGVDRVGSEADRGEFCAKVDDLWRFSCPTTSGSDDPVINPAKDPNLGKLGCGRVLVLVAGKDLLKDRGWFYKESLEKVGWSGIAQVVETKDEDHVFHMLNPTCENAMALLDQLVSFIKAK